MQPAPAEFLEPECPSIDLSSLPIRLEGTNPGRFALWVRLVFSAPVDADFLDTEAYMDLGKAKRRAMTFDIAQLREACAAHLDSLTRLAPDTLVNRIRANVLGQCRSKASLEPGLFSLCVPTGGGKTLSSLAFALDHAQKYRKRRVIYAIPYTSIIEQTADVFRSVFASLGDDVIVEHHSNAESEPNQETSRSRLASENWDSPIVVTTNVQLFESLFARKTSRCRKLHNLVDSVIVLDEAQLLPVEFLQPIVDILRYLIQDYGVTVLLCTATQPALNSPQNADPMRGLRRSIVQSLKSSTTCRRYIYHWNEFACTCRSVSKPPAPGPNWQTNLIHTTLFS